MVRPLDLTDLAPVTRPEPAARSHRRWVLLVVAGWLVQAGLRAWLSRAQMVPLATPDESAYLIAARVISGGVTADFSYSTLYPAGYPLLITPVFWFTHNPVTVYHAVLLGINAPISALTMPLGYVACRRLGLEPPWAFGVAMVAALLLGLVAYSFVVLNDKERKPAGVPEIQVGVTAQQFFWTYEYPSSVTGGKLPAPVHTTARRRSRARHPTPRSPRSPRRSAPTRSGSAPGGGRAWPGRRPPARSGRSGVRS